MNHYKEIEYRYNYSNFLLVGDIISLLTIWHDAIVLFYFYNQSLKSGVIPQCSAILQL